MLAYVVSVEVCNSSSNCISAHQDNSVSKGVVDVWIDSATICREPLCRATVNITLNNIRNYGSGAIHIYFDETLVKVHSIDVGDSETVIPNRIDKGHWVISASHSCTTPPDPCGISGNVVFAIVTFEPVDPATPGLWCTDLELVVETLHDLDFGELASITSNGSICNGDADTPILPVPIASPQTILNDNGRARVPGTNMTRITATVVDEVGVDTVTINLTPIRGPGHDAVAMTLIEGTDKAGIWAIDTNADYDPGVNMTHNLTVVATDYSSNSETAGAMLTVLRRGDVNRDNVVDMGDYDEVAMYVVGMKPAPDELVAGVVAADRFDGVDMADASYILMHIYCGYPAP
ncbi:MAG: hypothetical protein C5S49_03285 [Candidatus Methanogaster sp.]|nr:MAG: hypothetical protein C5S49_03285 [ANME-2 cluster archaeon]